MEILWLTGILAEEFYIMHRKNCLATENCLTTNKIPERFTRGRTTLILKDKGKGNAASNYRPSLPKMKKPFTGIMGDELYNRLEEKHHSLTW